MAWSLRISWENGQPRASFSHFMWRKPKTRQTNICSFFHNKHLREKTTNLREKTTALSLLRLYQLLFTCLLWKTTRHPLLVQFYTEQTKVQGSWISVSSRVFRCLPVGGLRRLVYDLDHEDVKTVRPLLPLTDASLWPWAGPCRTEFSDVGFDFIVVGTNKF